MGIETAIIGGSLISGVLGSKAASKGAKAQQAGYDAATAEQRRQYDTTRQDYAPWREAGAAALGRLQDPTTSFEASPGYEFRRGEGQRDLGNIFGGVRAGGGNAMRALVDYNQNMASNEFGNWWNRQAGLAGAGQNAVGGTAQAGALASGNISNNMIGAGNARASGIQNQYGSWNNALQGGIGNWMYAKQRGLLGGGENTRPEYDFQGRPINYGG